MDALPAGVRGLRMHDPPEQRPRNGNGSENSQGRTQHAAMFNRERDDVWRCGNFDARSARRLAGAVAVADGQACGREPRVGLQDGEPAGCSEAESPLSNGTKNFHGLPPVPTFWTVFSNSADAVPNRRRGVDAGFELTPAGDDFPDFTGGACHRCAIETVKGLGGMRYIRMYSLRRRTGRADA